MSTLAKPSVGSTNIRYAIFVHSEGERALSLRYTLDDNGFTILRADGSPSVTGAPAALQETIESALSALWPTHCPGFAYIGELKLNVSRAYVSSVYADIKNKENGAFVSLQNSVFGRVADAQRIWLERLTEYKGEGQTWMSYNVMLKSELVTKALEIAAVNCDAKALGLPLTDIPWVADLSKMLSDLVLECLAAGSYTLVSR